MKKNHMEILVNEKYRLTLKCPLWIYKRTEYEKRNKYTHA